MMSRRCVRFIVLAVVCAIASPWAEVARAHGVTLKIHHALPVDSVFHTQFLLPWKEKLEQESNGYLRIQVFPAMVANENPLPLYDQVKDRTADIVWTSVGNDAWRFPGVEVFNLPLSTNTAKGSNRALWEYIQANNLARREFSGVRLLAVHVSPAPTPTAASSPFSDIFVLVMNAETYRGLSDELKKVINANSGADMSATLGRIFDDNKARAGQSAGGERSDAVAQQSAIDNRIKELDQRGLDGKELVESARALLTQYDRPH